MTTTGYTIGLGRKKPDDWPREPVVVVNGALLTDGDSWAKLIANSGISWHFEMSFDHLMII